MRELSLCIPNSEVRDRRNADLKKIIPKAIENGYTDMVVVNEDHKEPSIPSRVTEWVHVSYEAQLCAWFYILKLQ